MQPLMNGPLAGESLCPGASGSSGCKKPFFRGLLVLAALAAGAGAQQPINYEYVYDAGGRLIRVVDTTGISVQYSYDNQGNIKQITRGTVSTVLSVVGVSPAAANPGSTVRIQGLGFSATPGNNTVKFNGVPATAVDASPYLLTVTVPESNSATTGPVTVTVGGNTATFDSNFTVLAAPRITKVTGKYLLSGQNGLTLAVEGVNLTGATFTALPPTSPAALTIVNTQTAASSATLTVNTGGITSTVVLVATTPGGSSSSFALAGYTVTVLLGDADSDGDGLTNADELGKGYDPLNPDTDGDQMYDGWEWTYHLNALNKDDASQLSKAQDGLLNVDEFNLGLDPNNPNRSASAITSTLPVNLAGLDGSPAVPINSNITFTFNQPILNPAQIAERAKFNPHVTNGTITVNGVSSIAAGTTRFSVDGRVLAFTPSGLERDTTYTITISGFRSAAGVVTPPYTLTFHTSNQPDNSPITIVRSNPSAGLTGVPLNASVSVEFNKPIVDSFITPNSISLSEANRGTVTGTVKWDKYRRVATLTPGTPFGAGHEITVSIGKDGPIRDNFNNSFQGQTFKFTTGFAADTGAPAITARSPRENDHGIPRNAQIMLQFSEPVNEITATSNVHVLANGTEIPGTFTFPQADTQLLFMPAPPEGSQSPSLLPLGEITVTVDPGVTDVRGNPIGTIPSYSFTVDSESDTTGPAVLSYSPLNGATGVGRNASVQVRFNERINPLTVSLTTFFLQNTNNPYYAASIPGTVNVSADRQTVTFQPAGLLDPTTTYCLSLSTYGSRVTDLAGNAPGNFTPCFTTSTTTDSAAPAITSINPPNGTPGVPLNAAVVAQVSKPLSAVSFQTGLTTIAVPLNAGDGNPVDLGLFQPGQVLTLAAGGSGSVGSPGVPVVPDGSLWTPAPAAFAYATPSASGYPQTAGGDGKNHFAGGGLNVSATGADFGFAGKHTTDTTDPAAIRWGALVGTFSQTPAPSDWFLIGAGATITVPQSATASHLYLAVNSYQGNAGGSYLVSYGPVPAPPSVVTVSANGVPVPGAASLSSDGMSITFNPAAQLKAATPYVVHIAGASDYLGNALLPFTSTFTTGTASDTTPPAALSFSPANGATEVPTNALVKITFSKLLNPLSVNSSTLVVQHAATNVQLKGSLTIDNSGAGAVVTFTPAAPLPSNSTIQIGVAADITDLAGNRCVPAGATFTTVGTADNTAPAVTSVSPTDGSTDLGLNTVVTLSFSKPLNPATVNPDNFALFAGTTRLDTAVHWSKDYQTVNLTGPLPNNRTISVVATHNVTDLAGNPLPDFRSSFATVPADDIVRPSIVGMRPAEGTTVPVNGPIYLFASKPLNPGTVNGALHVSQSTYDGLGGALNSVIVPGTITLNSGNQTVVFTPAVPFPAGARVQIDFDSTAADTAGNALNRYQSNVYANGAQTGFYAVSYSPSAAVTATNPVIEMKFNQPLDPLTVNSNYFLLLDSTSSYPGTPLTVQADFLPGSTTTVRITPTPASQIKPGRSYTFTAAAGVKNLAGDTLTYESSGYFIVPNGAVPDLSQPRVISVSPPASTTGVGTNASIEVVFNKDMNPTTITEDNIAITSGGNPVGSVNISFGSSGQPMVLTPKGLLPDGATITVTVSKAEDLYGNLVVPFSYTFQTRVGPDVSNVNLVAVNPPDQATNVPTNTSVSIQFDEPIDPLAVYFNVQDITSFNSGFPGGTISVSPNGLVATFVPNAPLAVGHHFSISLFSSTVRDLAGNPLSVKATYNFTTALSSSTAPPQVTNVSPENGVTGIPINSLIQVKFSEPIQSDSIRDITLSANGSVVSGVVNSLRNANSIVTISPPAILLPNTSYSLNIAGPRDFAGHMLSPSVSSSFTTGPGADLSAPAIIHVNPPSGSANIGTNVNPTLVLNKRISTVTLDGTTFRLMDDSTNTVVKSTIVLSADRTVATLKPASPLLTNSFYTIFLNGATDLEGNAISGGWSFSTGSGPDTTPPAITATNPPNGTLTAPVNVPLMFYSNKPISPASFNASTAVVLMAGAAGVGGTATLSSDLQTIVFQQKTNLSNNNLTASTAYTAKLSGFTDLAGNLVTPFTLTFSTENSGQPENTAPVLNSTAPANASMCGPGFPASCGTITLTFNEAMNPVSANFTNLQVTNQTVNLPIAGTFAVSGSTITFTPASPLPNNTDISVSVGGVQDLAGNAFGGASFSFATSGVPDTTPPSVTSVTPPNNSTNVGLYNKVILTFSEPLDPATITTDNFGLYVGPTRLPFYMYGPISRSSDARTVVLTLNSMPAGSTVQVVVTGGVHDLSGNALPEFQSSFTTVANAVAPYVIGQNPQGGASQVPATASIQVYFSQPMDPASTTGSLVVSQNGVAFPGTAALSGAGQVLTFSHAIPFAAGATIQVFLQSATNTSGVLLSAYSSSFTAIDESDAVGLIATAVSPSDYPQQAPLNTVGVVRFNKPIDPNTVVLNGVNLNTVYISPYSTTKVPASIFWIDDRTIAVQPLQAACSPPSPGPLCPNTNYLFTYDTGPNGIKDKSGNTPAYAASAFRTGTASDLTKPRVLSVSPPTGATGVGVNAPITLHFSKAIDPLTLMPGPAPGGTVQLIANGTTISTAAVSVRGNTTSGADMVISPYQPFPDNTQITISATTGIQDAQANPLAVAFSSTFTTGAGPALKGATATAFSPVFGAANVPLTAAVQVTTDIPIDPATVNSTTMAFKDITSGGVPVDGTWSVSANGRVLSFAPKQPGLSASHTYALVCGQVFDINGYLLFCSSGTEFTTVAQGSPAPLSVITTDPPSGYSNVPTNLMPQILFNQPIQPGSVSSITLTPSGGAALTLTPSFGNANQTLTLIPPGLLKPSTDYTLSIAGVTDVTGAGLPAPVTVTFKTGTGPQLAAPSSAYNIIDSATDVPVATVLKITFSAPINPVTVSPAALRLVTTSNGQTVPSTLQLSNDGLTLTLTLTPNPVFQSNTIYTLVRPLILTDLAGNLVFLPPLTFTTGN